MHTNQQYEEDCLEVALYLLRELNANECRSAAVVARSVIAHVNPRDASGVLAGCFTGNYGGGVHPCKWNGSTSILQRFHKSKTPIRYSTRCCVSLIAQTITVMFSTAGMASAGYLQVFLLLSCVPWAYRVVPSRAMTPPTSVQNLSRWTDVSPLRENYYKM